MKYTFLLAITLFMFSCGNKKVIQLPEIDHAEITKISDVSAAYLFYDETQPDSVSLNRKNLISTTNWLINVDKRLRLKQVIPHIQFLQEKKQNAGHKNPNAKNYFSSHDTSNNNLGFLEFTDVIYHEERIRAFDKNNKQESEPNQKVFINVISNDSIPIHYATGSCSTSNGSNKDDLLNGIKSDLLHYGNVIIYVGYHKNISFQDYIGIKSKLNSFELGNAKISNHEFITD
ncbi:hypothetical protein [Aestuariivivens marinum]|uniref:hypothetical protein n=1 Tax=Aestuariivivens marinum TaxID=2913555 RepID=UPI001F58328F|nr:hypothetical protein [Aestuariivivens marinum]